MIAVIQCAATKRSDAGHLRRQDGTRVMFVADPAKAPADSECVFARPDDVSDTGASWRQAVIQYNANPTNNPLGLLRAFELYQKAAYRRLVEYFGASNVFILSAGWGLIGASFLTPDYDITFSAQARQKAPWKFRGEGDRYEDLCHLPIDTADPVIFFGGRDYVPLFCKLTRGIRSRRTIFYRASTLPEKTSKPPEASGCALQGFPTDTRTNWHYECVKAFLEDRIAVQP
jgi:hypothetical protein